MPCASTVTDALPLVDAMVATFAPVVLPTVKSPLMSRSPVVRAILINVFVPSPNANLSRLASLTISNLLAPSASTSFASTPDDAFTTTDASPVDPD